MKKTALTLLFALAGVSSVFADDVIEDAMKKYHKPEDGIAKKVGKGEATDAEIAELITAYEAMSKATPPKGDKDAFQKKCEGIVAALKKVQAKDASGVSEYKKGINCKACHDVFRAK